VAITLDFNVKNGSVVKTTSILKEPSVERNFELRRSAKFSSRESSVMKSSEDNKTTTNIMDESTYNDHTLRYSTGGVLSTKSAQAQSKDNQENSFSTANNNSKENLTFSALNPSDLPFIDEDERELDEAIRDATGLAQDQVVASIQLGSTASNPPASTLLVSQRSYSGTDTICSEKVIKRDYRDL